MKTNFHNKNLALSLAVIISYKETRKWTIWWMLESPGLETGFGRYALVLRCERQRIWLNYKLHFSSLTSRSSGVNFYQKIGIARSEIVFCKPLYNWS